jgi:peptidoglycan-associated lipoprotein
MSLTLLLAALLAQTGPRESFIICPGHPRCPRVPAGQGSNYEAQATPAPGEPITRPPPPPPAQPGEAGDRNVYFAVGSAMLDAPARAVLDEVAAWLAANPSRPVSIEGHADSRGPAAQNAALAGRRAAAVRDYLVARGVAAERLTAISYGETQPALYDSGESVWMMNRRVEIRIR